MARMTTIRVECAVRDRLAARAAEHGRTLGEELGALLDEVMGHEVRAGYERMSAEELADYHAEAELWSSAGLDDLAATAAEEFPEYNDDPHPGRRDTDPVQRGT